MRTAVAATCVSLLSAAAAAGPTFSDQTLQQSGAVYGPNLQAMVFEDIPARLPPEALAGLAGLSMELPLRHEHPMNFYALIPIRTIVAPISSIRFIDEYSRVWAWFESQRCQKEYILSYVAESIGLDRPTPGPLEAFGLSDAILQDDFTDDVSQKILKSIIYYALSHEIGHILAQHGGNADNPYSVQEEIEADALAIEIFRRTGVPPVGVVFYFFAAQFFDSDSPSVTHPPSPDRIVALASAMRNDPASFAWSEPDPQVAVQQVTYLADQLAGIADVLRDPEYREHRIEGLQMLYPSSDWLSACPE